MVDFDNTAAQQAEDEVWGALQGRSIKVLGWTTPIPGAPKGTPGQDMPIGSSHEGILKEMPSRRQATDYTTRAPKTYSDGNPIMEVVLVLETGYRDPGDTEDDGTRRLILNNIAQRGLQDEMRRLNIQRFGIGTHVKAKLVGLKPNPQGRPSKLIEFELTNVQPYIPVSQRSVEEQLAAAKGAQQPAAQPQAQWATEEQHAQATQQYVAPAQPAFAGQVVPAPAAPTAAPQAAAFDEGALAAAVRQLEASNFTRDLALAAVTQMPQFKGVTVEQAAAVLDALV